MQTGCAASLESPVNRIVNISNCILIIVTVMKRLGESPVNIFVIPDGLNLEM